jgi:hypothetical protein
MGLPLLSRRVIQIITEFVRVFQPVPILRAAILASLTI